LHFLDPHEPFRDHGRGLPAHPSMTPLGLRERAATTEERELIRTLYRGEVRHLDRGLAPLLAELPADATVAFLSDHGEALGEHGVWGHALTLYQEVVAVPLLLRGPGFEAGSVDEPVQLLDLAPTLLQAAGATPAEGMAGRSLLPPHHPGRGRQPIRTATYSAGPLRWAWRDRARKVVIRTVPQGEGVPGTRNSREAAPLPPGAFVHPLPGEEGRPAPLAPDLALRVAGLFARSAGTLVPGVTILVAGVRGPAEVSFEASGELAPMQVWGTSPVEVERRGSRWTIRTAEAHPLAGVAFQAPAEVEIVPLAGTLPWAGGPPGRPLPGRPASRPPSVDAPGVYLWWNDERRLEISGQEETERRLRALGYL
ncbi:MAG TPA: sulfatase-like hydrolase/transferase, partial [Thermoanaerobaculia bacterium]|nr:sulfatase-like hydrolase/transferase [Thermoanaerobaculia bacterium]